MRNANIKQFLLCSILAATTQAFATEELSQDHPYTFYDVETSEKNWVGPFTIKSVSIYSDDYNEGYLYYGNGDYIEVEVYEDVSPEHNTCSARHLKNIFSYPISSHGTFIYEQIISSLMSAQAQGKKVKLLTSTIGWCVEDHGEYFTGVKILSGYRGDGLGG
tara:strand:+ start:14185 stop:14670 length:486 start_codon:yes stop_codon:yes gene_type:complete